MKSLTVLTIFLFCHQLFARNATLDLQFQIQQVGQQKVLMLDGKQAEVLMKLLPAGIQAGSTERRGQIICDTNAMPGVGIDYQCYMLIK